MKTQKTITQIIATIFVMLNIAAAEQLDQQKLPDPEQQTEIIRKLSNSFVIIKYELKADKGQSPELSGWSNLCPNCGSYHSVESGDNVLDEQRPLETAGYLITPQKALTRDMMIHPRFVKNITVHFNEISLPAEIVAYAENTNAALLQWQSPLEDAQPLTFQDVSDEDQWLIISYAKTNGRWAAGIKKLSGSVVLTDKGKSFRTSGGNGIVVNTEGNPVAVIMNDKTPLDYSWTGSVLKWNWIDNEHYKQLTDKIRDVADNCLLRTKLNFRSPKKSSRTRGFFYDDFETDEAVTEMNTIAVIVDNSRALVLANLQPKVTARLNKITLFTPQGDTINADFHCTLNDYGAFLADLEKPLDTTVDFTDIEITDCLDKLFFFADTRMRGDDKIIDTAHTRIPGIQTGWRNQLYLDVLHGSRGYGFERQNQATFVFDTDAKLISFPVPRRIKVRDESRWYSSQQSSTPFKYIRKALANLDENIDKSNIPLSEAEENRLAWMGVELQPLDKDLARINKVSDLTKNGSTGALISYVYPDSPAQKAQIQPGTVLLRLHVEDMPKPIDIDLSDSYSFYMEEFPWDELDMMPSEYFDDMPQPWPSVDNKINKTLTNLGFGKKYTADFAKDGKAFKKDFTVVESPKYYGSAEKYKSPDLGMTVRNLTYEVRRFFQKNEDDPGVIVSKIERGEKAAVAGIKPYEIITHVNDKPVMTVDEFENMIAQQEQLKLSIVRKLQGRIVNIKMD
jgi:hypothetical protein